jgi:hypothetical protein
MMQKYSVQIFNVFMAMIRAFIKKKTHILDDHNFLPGVCSIHQKLQFKELEVYLQPILVSS